jgi:hypothetical protein
MLNITFTPPNPEQRRTLLEEYGFKFDRRIREEECSEITSLSRSSWKMEQQGASLRAATLAAIVVPGFCPMCFGGSVTLLQYLTSITHIAVNRLNRNGVQTPQFRLISEKKIICGLLR